MSKELSTIDVHAKPNFTIDLKYQFALSNSYYNSLKKIDKSIYHKKEIDGILNSQRRLVWKAKEKVVDLTLCIYVHYFFNRGGRYHHLAFHFRTNPTHINQTLKNTHQSFTSVSPHPEFTNFSPKTKNKKNLQTANPKLTASQKLN